MYIVLTAESFDFEHDPALFMDTRVHLCEDSPAVQKILGRKDQDWLLFEMVGSKAVQCTVCFQPSFKINRSK